MGKFKGGIREAGKMLDGLDLEAQKRVLKLIEKKDPIIAEKIRENRVVFEDLIYLNTNMMMDLLKEVDLGHLALGLRIASPELQNHILGLLTKRLKAEVEDVIKGPLKPVSEVQSSIEEVMTVVRKKVEQGIFKLSPQDGDEYV